MPSHKVHRLCGALVGLPEDVVAFVDKLIDTGKCGAHDVGLEILTERLSEHLDISAALEHGAWRLLKLARVEGRLLVLASVWECGSLVEEHVVGEVEG